MAYRGLTTGISTLQETVKALGSYTSRQSFTKYAFPGAVQVAFQNNAIKTIIIQNKEYVDGNGIRVGMDRRSVESLPDIERRSDKDSISDLTNGVVYWFDSKDKVTKIVLIAEFYL